MPQRNQLQASAARWILAGVLVIGTGVATFSHVARAMHRKLDAVTIVLGDDPTALGKRLFEAPGGLGIRLDEQQRAALRARIASKPLDGGAFALAGLDATARGDKAGAARLMAHALRLDPRTRLAWLWRLDDQVRGKRTTEAAATALRLLSIDPLQYQGYIPILASLARDRRNVAAIGAALRANPGWREPFLNLLQRDGFSPSIRFAIMEAGNSAGFTVDREHAGFITDLVAKGDYERAYLAWISYLPDDALSGVGTPYDDSFKGMAGPPPFNWQFAAAEGDRADPGETGLDISYSGRKPTTLASQTVVLQPGGYRLRSVLGDANSEGPTRSNTELIWHALCLPSNRELATLTLDVGTIGKPQYSPGFMVLEGDCGAITLSLTGSASEFPVRLNARVAAIHIDTFAAASAPQPPAPTPSASAIPSPQPIGGPAMNRTAPIIPAAVFLCIAMLFGGSASAGLYGNAAIQLMAAAGIALALVSHHNYPGGTQRGLLVILAATLALALAQLIPLPPDLWTALPGRAAMAEGLQIAGIGPGWHTLSMTPEATIGAALGLLPVIAAALIGMRAPRVGLVTLLVVLIMLTALSVGIGLAQRMTGIDSPLYVYAISNRGEATGLFANSNHLATLCAISIPLATALFVAQRGSTQPNASWLMLIVIVLIALLGVVLANSLAGIGLAAIAMASIYFVARLRRGDSKVRMVVLGAVGLTAASVALIAVVLLWGHIAGDQLYSTRDMSRTQLWQHTAQAIAATMPFGSGLGGFASVYPQYEDAGIVTRVFANHAHNDILELTMTGGVPAIILMLGFAAWWLRTTVVIWTASTRDAFSEAATVATGIIMLHEFVDYPIRTAAMAVVFGLCCGIMARPRRIVEPEEAPVRASRHMAA